MIPAFNHQDGAQGSGYFRSNSEMMDVSAPLNGIIRSNSRGLSGSRDFESTYFGYTLPSPLHVNQGDLGLGLRHYGSTESISTDISPMSTDSRKWQRAESLVESHRLPNVVKTNKVGPGESVPVLRLGDEGRAKLKSALSEQVRRDPEMKARVEAIGKIRLASIQQLMMMAKECNLWEFVEMLALEHEVSRDLKRSS